MSSLQSYFIIKYDQFTTTEERHTRNTFLLCYHDHYSAFHTNIFQPPTYQSAYVYHHPIYIYHYVHKDIKGDFSSPHLNTALLFPRPHYIQKVYLERYFSLHKHVLSYLNQLFFLTIHLRTGPQRCLVKLSNHQFMMGSLWNGCLSALLHFSGAVIFSILPRISHRQ